MLYCLFHCCHNSEPPRLKDGNTAQCCILAVTHRGTPPDCQYSTLPTQGPRRVQALKCGTPAGLVYRCHITHICNDPPCGFELGVVLCNRNRLHKQSSRHETSARRARIEMTVGVVGPRHHEQCCKSRQRCRPERPNTIQATDLCIHTMKKEQARCGLLHSCNSTPGHTDCHLLEIAHPVVILILTPPQLLHHRSCLLQVSQQQRVVLDHA